MEDIDEVTQNIIIAFLKKQYPIRKLRDKRRFKRGIILDEYINNGRGFGFLKPNSELKQTFNSLHDIVRDIFGVTEYETNLVVLKYLNLI